MPQPPTVLAIGHMDTGGRQGLCAYAEGVSAAGAVLLPVTACVTARDRRGELTGVGVLPPSVVARQMDAAATHHPEAVVVGMLGRHQTASRVVERIRRRELKRVVLCPRLAMENGRQLMTSKGTQVVAGVLGGLADLVICSAPELEILAGRAVRSRAEAEEAARDLVSRGASAVLMLDAPGLEDGASMLIGAETSLVSQATPAGERGAAVSECDFLAGAAAGVLAKGRALEDAVREAHEALRIALQ